MTASSRTAPQARAILPRQDALPLHADLHEAFDVIAIEFARPAHGHLPGIVLGLEQARDHGGLEVADGGRPGFQADVDLVGIGQHIFERVPPARLAGFAGQPDQAVALRPGDAVEPEQHLHIAGLRAAAAGLDPEDR
ncbi:MAG TPA: hypothetical protein VH641_19925 [Streptosporangiaceae bacterium]|jgi:hypothetical protein